LGGQIAWLLPLAFLALVAAGWRRVAWQTEGQQQSLILWGGWLLTMAVFFSVAGFIHPYYLTEMAPAIAALAGIGIVTMWRDFRRADWRGWLFPIALIATLAEQVYLLRADPNWESRLIPVIAILVGFGIAWIVGARIVSGRNVVRHRRRPPAGALAVGVAALLLAPAVWAALPVVRMGATPQPVAGPAPVGPFDFERGEGSAQPSRALERFLAANQGTARFLLATPSSMAADAFILATGQPVMAIGGFAGQDPILTPGALATLVANNTVRFMLLNPLRDDQNRSAGFGAELGSQTAITAWVKQNCAVVPPTSWGDATAHRGNRSPATSTNLLYDCDPGSMRAQTRSSGN
jgi:4-amino-4-deoxy-L-arabinose transferase-like glycosyltransferase